jgi:hypothetical protein
MHATASVAHGTYDSTLTGSSAWDASASAEEVNGLQGFNDSKGNCVRGAFIALGVEAAMVFMVYGIWHLWHLVR